MLVENNILPEYFFDIKKRLKSLNKENPLHYLVKDSGTTYIGGGTDLYVQKPDNLYKKPLIYLWNSKYKNNRISIEENCCVLESGCTFADIENSKTIGNFFPKLKSYLKLMASKPIRNLATIGGNIINASPIGDMIIYFLALDSKIVIRKDKSEKEIFLKDFYLDYKKLDMEKNDYIHSIKFLVPHENSYFNFEKVSKRTHLDIASVNSAISVTVDNNEIITSIGLSAGGLAPVPKYFDKTVNFLKGKTLSPTVLIEAQDIAQTEVIPISDARGTKEYKRLLFRQLFFTHFITLFGDKFELEDLI
jgi:xanthine dehydrogenase small subunit